MKLQMGKIFIIVVFAYTPGAVELESTCASSVLNIHVLLVPQSLSPLALSVGKLI